MLPLIAVHIPIWGGANFSWVAISQIAHMFGESEIRHL